MRVHLSVNTHGEQSAKLPAEHTGRLGTSGKLKMRFKLTPPHFCNVDLLNCKHSHTHTHSESPVCPVLMNELSVGH